MIRCKSNKGWKRIIMKIIKIINNVILLMIMIILMIRLIMYCTYIKKINFIKLFIFEYNFFIWKCFALNSLTEVLII